jgi:hypothetical protein
MMYILPRLIDLAQNMIWLTLRTRRSTLSSRSAVTPRYGKDLGQPANFSAISAAVVRSVNPASWLTISPSMVNNLINGPYARVESR